MPIEIRELNIKVTVNQPSAAGGEGSSASNELPQPGGQQPSADKVVANAVEQVMDLMRQQNER